MPYCHTINRCKGLSGVTASQKCVRLLTAPHTMHHLRMEDAPRLRAFFKQDNIVDLCGNVR